MDGIHHDNTWFSCELFQPIKITMLDMVNKNNTTGAHKMTETITLTGWNRRGREITVTVEVITHGRYGILVQWTDGKCAQYSGNNVFRHSTGQVTTLLKDTHEGAN
jgi:hypothetical protein